MAHLETKTLEKADVVFFDTFLFTCFNFVWLVCCKFSRRNANPSQPTPKKDAKIHLIQNSSLEVLVLRIISAYDIFLE